MRARLVAIVVLSALGLVLAGVGGCAPAATTDAGTQGPGQDVDTAKQGGPEIEPAALAGEATVTLTFPPSSGGGMSFASDEKTGDQYLLAEDGSSIYYYRAPRPGDPNRTEPLTEAEIAEAARVYAEGVLGDRFRDYTQLVRPGQTMAGMVEYTLPVGDVYTFNRLVVSIGRSSGIPTNVIYERGPVTIDLEPKVTQEEAEKAAKKEKGDTDLKSTELWVVRFPAEGERLVWEVWFADKLAPNPAQPVMVDALDGTVLNAPEAGAGQ